MFVFKFEKLLKIKEDLIKKYMLEIANIEFLIKQNMDKRYDLDNDRIVQKNKLNDMLKDRPDKNMLLFVYENIDRLNIKINELDNVIESLKKEKMKKLDIIKTLNIEKKKLEKLKEKEYERYRQEESKLEMRFLDEIASIKAANKIIGH